MKHVYSFLMIMLLTAVSLQAQTINGRLVTSAYGWERQDINGASTSHFRAYENIQLNVGTSDVSFHTYLQGSTDFSNQMSDDPTLRLFNVYARVKNMFNMVDVKLGRQAVFAGVNYGTIDGAALNIRPTDGVEVMAYGGGLTPPGQRPDFFQNIHDNWQLGGQVLLYLVQNTKIGVSYMNRHREMDRYWAWRPDEQMNLAPELIDFGSRANQYGSLNVAHSTGNFWLFGRYDYDFNFERTSRAEVAGTWQVMPELGLSANFAHREPVLAYNSYFALVEASANQEAALGVDYRIHPRLTLLGRFSTVMFDEENALRVSLGAANKYASIMYTKDVSYDGDLDGFNLQFTYPLFEGKLIPHVGAMYSSYALAENLEKTSTWVGVFGTTVRPVKTLSVDVQGQYMTNKIYKSDMRAFARVSYWFSEALGL
jgi:hypothetical protein